MYPTTPVLVLGFHDRLTMCCAAALPLPVSASVMGLAALLANDNEAVAVPDACGWNVTVNVADLPAANAIGNVTPLTTNSVLELVIDETVTGEPVAVSVPERVAVEPVATVPKFKVAGARLSCPVLATLPESATFSCGFEALDAIASWPEAVPLVVGLKTTLKVTLCPAETLAGSVRPLIAKAPLDTLAPESVTLLLPAFATVTVRLFDCPIARVPKLNAVGEAVT